MTLHFEYKKLCKYKNILSDESRWKKENIFETQEQKCNLNTKIISCH